MGPQGPRLQRPVAEKNKPITARKACRGYPLRLTLFDTLCMTR